MNVIVLEHIHTEGQLADLLTKTLDTARVKTFEKSLAYA